MFLLSTYKSSFLRMYIVGLTALSLIGCVTPVQANSIIRSAEDAGNVYVSAYPDVPWSEISSKLVPQNHLTMDEARKLATVTTQAQESQVASIFAAGLAIGLKSSNAPGSSPSVPATSGMPSTTLPSLSSDLTKGMQNYQVNGDTYIKEATALYQQAQILDNQFTMGFFPKGYSLHLITLQVNVQPKRLDEDYDVYVDVSLWPNELSKKVVSHSQAKSIVIYPLIITDAMELTSVEKSIQAIRQAALQLSGLIGIAGLNGDMQSSLNKLNTLVGYEKNSLVTVGRINTNEIRIRFGAENSGLSSSGLALVPRVYNVSLAVMVPNEIESLRVVTHASFISAKDGRKLPAQRSRVALANKVRSYIYDYGYQLCNSHCTKPAISHIWKDNEACQDAYLNILRAADWQDYEYITKRLEQDPSYYDTKHGADKPSSKCQGDILENKTKKIEFHRFLSNLTEIQVDSLYSDFQIPLEPHEKLKSHLPGKDHLALLSDNPKGSAVIVLPGGSDLEQNKIKAYLTVDKTCTGGPGTNTSNCSPFNGEKLYAEKITYVKDTGLTMTFPSLLENGLQSDASEALHVLYGATQASSYQVASIAAPVPQPSPPSPATVLSKIIVADRTGRGTVDVAAKFDSSLMNPVLMVGGANITSVNNLTTPTSKVSIGANGISLSTGQVYAIQLSDLLEGNSVSLKVTDASGKKTLETIPPLLVINSFGKQK